MGNLDRFPLFFDISLAETNVMSSRNHDFSIYAGLASLEMKSSRRTLID
jgi:hypothetical protein